MSMKANLRKQINARFILDADLDAFLIDYFDAVWKAVSRGMSRQEKINQLLSLKGDSEIETALLACKQDVSAEGNSNAASGLEQSGIIRQEVLRLQYIIRDLEQQLSTNTQESKPSIHSRNGLERIQKSLKDFEESASAQTIVHGYQWTALGHNALASLEASLGRYHNITRDFRYRFIIEKEFLSQNYQALLSAAAAILKQEVAEDERAAQSWEQNNAALSRRSRGFSAF